MSGDIFVLDENYQLHQIPVGSYEIVKDRYIIYDSYEDEYVPFDDREDFLRHLAEVQPSSDERYYQRDEKFYRYYDAQGREKIRPSEDVLQISEVIDPQKVNAKNLELYLKLRDNIQAYNFEYLYLASYHRQDLSGQEKNSDFFPDDEGVGYPYTLLSAKWSQAQMGLVAQDRKTCRACPGRIYRYKPKRSLRLVRLDDSLRPTDLVKILNLFPSFPRDLDLSRPSLAGQMRLLSSVCQELQNYRIDGYYDTLHLGGFPLCVPKKLLVYEGVSYLLVSPDKPMTLNHQGDLITGDYTSNPQYDPIYVAIVSSDAQNLEDIKQFRYVPHVYRAHIQTKLIKYPDGQLKEIPVISDKVNIDNRAFSRDYLFSADYVPSSKNYSNQEFSHYLLTDRDKLMAIFRRRR